MTGKEHLNDQMKLHVVVFTLRDGLRCIFLFAIGDHVQDH